VKKCKPIKYFYRTNKENGMTSFNSNSALSRCYDTAYSNEFITHGKNSYEFNNVNGKRVEVVITEEIGGGVAGTVYKVRECFKINDQEKEQESEKKAISLKKHKLSFRKDSQRSHKKQKTFNSGANELCLLNAKKEDSEIEKPIQIFAMKAFFDKEYYSEFLIGKTFDHPNIIKIFDYTEGSSSNEEMSYMLMEYVEGVTLLDRLKKHISLEELLKWVAQLLGALEHCYKNRVIPVDIKDQNIMINQENDLKLIDFGFYNTFEKFEDPNIDYKRDLVPHDFFDCPEVTTVIREMVRKCSQLTQNNTKKIISDAINTIPHKIGGDAHITDAFKSYLDSLTNWYKFFTEVLKVSVKFSHLLT
jgi:serine/threonine protein kinase